MKQSQKGFTLIELMVVAGMLALISLAAIPQYNRFRQQQQVQAAAAQLQSAIRQAQNFAISGAVCKSGLKAEYWAMLLSDNDDGSTTFSFVITPLRKNPSNGKLEAKCSDGSDPVPIPRLVRLIGGVAFDSVWDGGATPCQNHGHLKDAGVVFSNISGQVTYLYKDVPGGCSPGNYFEFLLAGSGGAARVRVESGGAVYILP